MSYEFDSSLSQLPAAWDRNFNAEYYVYEVVNEHTNPVLQVFYTQPNEIHVNGLFVLGTNSILGSFGGPPQLFTSEYKLIDRSSSEVITNYIAYLGTNSLGKLITNALYGLKFPEQKTIFKYPSNRNPGVFAN